MGVGPNSAPSHFNHVKFAPVKVLLNNHNTPQPCLHFPPCINLIDTFSLSASFCSIIVPRFQNWHKVVYNLQINLATRRTKDLSLYVCVCQNGFCSCADVLHCSRQPMGPPSMINPNPSSTITHPECHTSHGFYTYPNEAHCWIGI